MTTASHRSPTEECDLVMKGGITSGVVYPPAVLELRNTYRFRSIGGSSAGAIAAALTAGAEYKREDGGFDRFEDAQRQVPDRASSCSASSNPLRGHARLWTRSSSSVVRSTKVPQDSFSACASRSCVSTPRPSGSAWGLGSLRAYFCSC